MTSQLLDSLKRLALPPVFIIEDGKQRLQNGLTWANIFAEVEAKHWHCVYDKQGKLLQRSPHSESLIDHLCACGAICYAEAVKTGRANPLKYYLAGLLHDIGKPATFNVRGKKIRFKGHALVGGAMLENLWTAELGQLFGLTRQDWADISTATDVHMCGYFPDISVECGTVYMDTFRLLSPAVRDLLVILRLGDNLGLTPHPAELAQYDPHVVLDSQSTFETNIMKPIRIGEYCSFYGLNKGVLIQVQGTSASGKSTMAKTIQQELSKTIPPKHIVVINRDTIMVGLSRKYMGLAPVSEITPEVYRACHKFYVENNKFYADKINAEMRQTIEDTLEMGGVAICDTMATMFSMASKTIIPTIAKNALKLSIWCHRNTLITEEETVGRLGMTMEEQLAAHDSRSLMNPFRDLRWNWSDSTSLTELKPTVMLEKEHDTTTRAHISVSLGWTGIKADQLNSLLNHVAEAYAYNQTLPRMPVLNETMDYSLGELLHRLYMNGGAEWVRQFFKRYAYAVSQPMKGTNYEHNVFGIKYIDGINNIWKPKWAREARGRFYWVDAISALPLKDTLQRGIELLTKAHTEETIRETQDISPATLDRVDEVQAGLLATFANDDQPIRGCLTGKVDGSLLLINYYPKFSRQYGIMRCLVDTVGPTAFWVETDKALIVPATQGTLFIGDAMWDYFLTAMSGVISMELDPGCPPTKLWQQVRDQVANWVERQVALLPFQPVEGMINLTYEMVCANRTTYLGNIHTELAVGYPQNSVSLLGLYYEGRYYPHFELPATEAIVQHPVWIEVSNTSEVFQIIRDLDAVVLGKSPMRADYPLHPEGFVYLHHLVDGNWDYSKIKLPVYYECHKVRENRIPYLLGLPDITSDYFPVLKQLKRFITELEPQLVKYVSVLYELVKDQIIKGSPCYENLNPRARVRVDAYLDNPTGPDAQSNLETIFKMYINTCGDYMTCIYYNVAREVYSINTDKATHSQLDSVKLFSKDLLMKVQPWRNDISTEITRLISEKDSVLKTIYGVLVETA